MIVIIGSFIDCCIVTGEMQSIYQIICLEYISVQFEILTIISVFNRE